MRLFIILFMCGSAVYSCGICVVYCACESCYRVKVCMTHILTYAAHSIDFKDKRSKTISGTSLSYYCELHCKSLKGLDTSRQFAFSNGKMVLRKVGLV